MPLKENKGPFHRPGRTAAKKRPTREMRKQRGITMTQAERRIYLIQALRKEQPEYAELQIPSAAQEQKRLLRTLLNIRMPLPISEAFLQVQDAYLQEEIHRKGVTQFAGMAPVQEELYLWQGDITTLRCGAIVNAANSRLLGCFIPCHGCIDNAIHTFAGIQLRLVCAALMQKQGHEEETGKAKITPAFNLPCQWILHTVGPVIHGGVSKRDEEQLASCYRSCLSLADQNRVESIAFCCISTGEFRFPNRRAAQIAVRAVQAYKAATHSKIKVIFNAFKQMDYDIYRELLGAN